MFGDDFSVDPIYNAILNESVSHIGIPFQVSRPELSELSVHMNHTAGPIPEFTILKVSDANQDDGDVVVESQRAAQTIGTTRKWYKVFDFDEPESLDTHATYSLRIRRPQAGNWALNEIRVSYQAGAGRFYLNKWDGANYVRTQHVGTMALQAGTRARTHVIGRNFTADANNRKEMLYQAQDSISVAEMTVLQLGLLDAASRTERKFSPLTTNIPIDVPPVGQQVRVIDTHNHLDTYLDIMGYVVSAANSDASNLAPVNMHWTLETRL